MPKKKAPAKSKKHAGGRPSKYNGKKTIRKVILAAEFLDQHPDQFLSACTEDQLGLALGVSGRGTVLNWAKEHPEFLDALKRWEASRNNALMKLAGVLPVAVWIFMTKNMLGWHDKQSVELGGKDGGAIRVKLEKVITSVDPNGPGGE